MRVTAGKPSEFRFRLSNFAKLPAGTITFQVRNAGVLAHDFKLCTTPLAGVLPSSALKDRCFGKPTKILKPGETTTLTLLLGKSGLYEYLSTIPRQAAAGMKGLLEVTAPPAAAAPITTTTAAATQVAPTDSAPSTTTSPTPPPPAGGGGMFGGGGR